MQMKIKAMKLKNFRSYKDEVIIMFSNLTAFVGKNDIGKSTILEALDIFFNNGSGAIKFDSSDLNVHAQGERVEIAVIFSDIPNEIVIDTSYVTSLCSEYLLNADGDFEVVKEYDKSKTNVYIRANHPTNPNCEDLLLKKNADLKKILKEKGIECENQAINSVMRKAIWSHYKDELNLQITKIDAAKEDAKIIWDKLLTYLPVYSLFQADRKNSDGDNEVQDPLKEAVKQIMEDEDIQKTLANVAKIVQGKLQDVSDRTLTKLREMDPAVAGSLNPVIPTPEKLKWSDVFKSVSISGDDNIPINKRGSGVKRLILLNFFRAEAERRAEAGDKKGIIYAIEEPETSQHSDNQRILIHALKELSQTGSSQVIITTHSSVIVKELDFSDIRLICKDTNGKSVMAIEPKVLQYPSLNEVNYIAYGEASVEYHNELYGFLEYQQWLSDYKKGRPQRRYVRLQKDGRAVPQEIVLSEYIRNLIHHPENQHNPAYTLDELKQSIQDMRAYIIDRRKRDVVLDVKVED